ncbi:MAG: DUF2007 domain-containing protein [Xanthomonadales bacterium]|nr:DUF2007 domain-containing protein [Xanthomonadales bacterium]
MKIVYRAENIIDANLVRDQLTQAGIQSFVNGSYLQGGVGELPASGLVHVTVADEEFEEARKIVDALQHDTKRQTGKSETHWDPSDELLDWQD